MPRFDLPPKRLPDRLVALHGLAMIACIGVMSLMQEAHAFAVEPHEMVHDVIQRVLAKVGAMDAAEDEVQGDVLEVFEQEISPHLDFDTITRWLAGERWESLAEDEKAELLGMVRGHIVHVYAALLARGRTVAIEVEPSSTVRTRSARVGALMATPEGRELNVEFRLIRSEETWKLYDLAIEGLSFARSLRAELGPVIDQGGVEALRSYLDAHR